jgi:hypothetical protein
MDIGLKEVNKKKGMGMDLINASIWQGKTHDHEKIRFIIANRIMDWLLDPTKIPVSIKASRLIAFSKTSSSTATTDKIRPICIASHIMKWFEKVLKACISKH